MYSSLTSVIQKWQMEFSKNGRLTCWTVMERSTWQRLKAEGELTCPISNTDDDPIFQNAYAWMKDSMASAGILAPAQGLSPWWCWVKRDESHPEPFIEDAEGLRDPVVLQLAVPSEQVVLSCFDLWHFVLNNWYVWSSELDEQDFDRAKEDVEEGSDAAQQLRQRMQKSWSAVFELDQSAVDMGPFEAKSIQGCFWTLRLTDVTAVIEPVALTSHH
ncbi:MULTISPECIES: DUF3841 domain-containing protein [unclassified Pseudomonas]|uniref:DUF3841 domain-containing protein n=1 Tax=unclassified Pseudomonas TaxID=196821 RepID=UPI001FD30B40|nr:MULTISPECIES: DUF3841 domain-containing protein [unclassified Pseudomonas]